MLMDQHVFLHSGAMDMPIVEKSSGRTLCTTQMAADVFGCTASHIRGLARSGVLWCQVESPRVVLYDLNEVKQLAKKHRTTRRKRGGRPPRGSEAA